MSDEKVSLADELKKYKEWASATVFDDTGKVLASTWNHYDDEIKALIPLYDNRDLTIGQGLVLGRKHFEVQRFHDNLIYGRLSSAREKEGVCLMKVINKKTQRPIYTVISYVAPTLSSRAIPQLREFAARCLETL